MVRFLKDADLARFRSASRRTFTHTRVLPNSAPATCLPLFPRSISRSTLSDRWSDKTWPTVRTLPRPRRFRLGTCETRCTSCSSASLGSSAGIADQTASSSTVNPNIHHRARIVVSLIDRAVISSPSPPLARASPSNAPPRPPRSPSAPAPKPARFARRAPSVPIIAIPSFASSSSSGRPLPSRPSPSVVARRPPRPRSRARPRPAPVVRPRARFSRVRARVDRSRASSSTRLLAVFHRRRRRFFLVARHRACGFAGRATTRGDAHGCPTDRFLCRVKLFTQWLGF